MGLVVESAVLETPGLLSVGVKEQTITSAKCYQISRAEDKKNFAYKAVLNTLFYIFIA